MILDVDTRKGCQTAAFTIGGATGGNNFMRSWDIKVTQYGCGNQDVSGPPGCLQYFTGETGDIMSFNFPTGAAVTATGNLQLYKKRDTRIGQFGSRKSNLLILCSRMQKFIYNI